VAATDTVSYRGTLSYWAAGEGAAVEASVQVVNAPGEGLQLSARDSEGREAGSWFQPSAAESRFSDSSLLSVLDRSYRLAGWTGVEVVGRPSDVLEARPFTSVNAALGTQPPVTARWWIDSETGLVLWQETYDSSGSVQTATGFRDLQLGPVTLGHLPPTAVPATTASLTVSRAPDLAQAGWSCGERLVGLSLVRLRSDAADDPGMIHMVYSDGVQTVSVIQQRGRLAGPPTGTAYDTALRAYLDGGSPRSATWQSGDAVFTVVTDSSPALLRSIVAALPHQGLPEPSTLERVQAGWSRILGVD
jgi:hypothetical protein